VKGRRGIRHKQLLDDLKKKRGYWKFKEVALTLILYRTYFRRGYGRVVRQATELMNLVSYARGGRRNVQGVRHWHVTRV
jgi:hypothetical protein